MDDALGWMGDGATGIAARYIDYPAVVAGELAAVGYLLAPTTHLHIFTIIISPFLSY